MSTPYIDRTNIIAKYKDKKINKNILLFGSDVEADASSRSSTKLMFDGDLLVHQDVLVCPDISHFLPLPLAPTYPSVDLLGEKADEIRKRHSTILSANLV